MSGSRLDCCSTHACSPSRPVRVSPCEAPHSVASNSASWRRCLTRASHRDVRAGLSRRIGRCGKGATPRPIVAWGNAPGIAAEPARAEGPAHAVGTLRWSGPSALATTFRQTWGVAPGYYGARRWRLGAMLVRARGALRRRACRRMMCVLRARAVRYPRCFRQLRRTSAKGSMPDVGESVAFE